MQPMMHSDPGTPVSTPQPPSGRKRPRPRGSPPASATTAAAAAASLTSAVHASSDETITIAAASITCFFILAAWFAQSALDEFHTNSFSNDNNYNSNHPLDLMQRHRAHQAPQPRPRRALLFKPLGGQGFGNVVNGLLSAHMLADEYDRMVCVDPSFKSFLMAFEPLQTKEEAEWCAAEWHAYRTGNGGNNNNSNEKDIKDQKERAKVRQCKIVNFSAGTLNECTLRECFSHDGPITFTGNTYPRWSHVSRDYFATHYQPTKLLEAVLPWHPNPPDVVVHLRKEDGKRDERKGLDDDTFRALGEVLPGDTFLVTNNVEWYSWFGSNYGWKNSGWFEVKHSILKKTWGSRGVPDQQEMVESMVTNKLNITVDQLHELTMYSDWWTLASAKEKVWHTHSDFSLSAVHWMNKESKTIMGMREATEEDLADHPDLKVGDRMLDLIDEEWIRDGETPRLVDRTLDMLKNCDEEQLKKLKAKAAGEAAKKRTERVYESIGDDDNPLRHVEFPVDLQMRFDSRQYAYFNPRST